MSETTTTEAPVALNTPHAREMLAKRYAAPEWALMEEVAPATGGGTRYADAIAVNLWQSRGHAVVGFEIKVSRSDWLRELKQPEKAEPLYRYCDRWYIVAPKGVVKDGELPPTWGLLELRETGLVERVPGPKLEATPITRAFFASLMRRGHETLQRSARRLVEREAEEARRQRAEQLAQSVRDSTRRHAELQKAVDEFEAKTGLSIGRYTGPPVATIELAKRLERLQHYAMPGHDPLSALSRLAGELEKAAAVVRDACAASGLGEPA